MSNASSGSIPGPIRRGRVRTGCLTCRARKVKCDERHPICGNCDRLQRTCKYNFAPTECARAAQEIARSSSYVLGKLTPESRSHGLEGTIDTLSESVTTSLTPTLASDVDDLSAGAFLGEWGDLFLHDTIPPSTPQTMIGSMGNWQIDTGQSDGFSYFVSHVDPPFITPWDTPNWTRIKSYILHSSTTSTSITAAILAVETLYRIVGEDGDGSDALPHYFTAKSTYLVSLRDEFTPMDTILLNTLLLCCFEIVAQQDTIPTTLKQKDLLVARLESWSNRPWSPIAKRVAVWLRLFHTKASHLGGRGILSTKVQEILADKTYYIPSLVFMEEDRITTYTAVSESYHQSLFQFYFELQEISMKASSLNRHHRPRGNLEDEFSVDGIAQDIKQQLDYLWQAHPPVIDVTHSELGEVLKGSTTDLAAFVRLSTFCKLSYYAEIIYLARAHGADRMSEDITTARVGIRSIVDHEMDTQNTRGLSTQLDAPFLWPLFLYCVESTTQADVDWALERLKLVWNPLWHATTIQSFIEALAKEQLCKNDRVDSRYFYYEEYGTVPPFL